MKTIKKIFAPLIISMALLFGGTAMADQIEISEVCSQPDATGDNAGCALLGDYGFEWTVLGDTDLNDGTAADTDTYGTFTATLENTGTDGLIDEVYFNVGGSLTLVTDCSSLNAGQICFDNVDPATWTIALTGNRTAVFTYVGESPNGNTDRLASGDTLSFDINLGTAVTYQDGFLSTPDDINGGGIGGGNDVGQVCVSYQAVNATLNGEDNDSDLLCGNYEDTPMETSEPGTLALLGLGLLGMGLARRRRTAV